MSRPRVVVDACLLVKGNVSNILFDLASSGLIALHWTPEIGDEFVRSWTRRRLIQDGYGNAMPQDEAEPAWAERKARALRRLEKFELMQREWRIPSWSFDAARAKRPPSRFGIEPSGNPRPDTVHPGDYHVALAACVLADVFPKGDIWLATENIAHLPPARMSRFRVWVLDQGLLLETLFDERPHAVAASLEKTISDTRRPPLTRKDMLSILESIDGMATVKTAMAMQAWWAAAKTRK